MSFLRSLCLQPRRALQVTSPRSQVRNFRPAHPRLLVDTKAATPDLYLKDEGIPGVGPGMTESEGSGSNSGASQEKYVAAGVLPSESHYGVPAGAYKSGDPLESQEEVLAPPKGQQSSASADYAHSGTTTKASRLESGVGSSSELRTGDAKGQMSKGSYGGEELSKGAKASENTLDERNPPPTAEMGEKGYKEAWKDRK